MIKGFRDFIAQGNVLDLAVAVIIGAAFAPIVEAVTNVIMGIIGALVGQPNFDSVGEFSINGSDMIQPGTIVTQLVNFLLVAAAVYFCIVMPMNRLNERRRKAAEEAAEPTDVELLTEIRDLLSQQRG
ncbi:large conductance mechanosensitive channel protein MscL [Actinomyces sp. 2119]|uniref:Large-conductance mechanosensitive channel n=1 Tax=Actinomyces lilanjuaniae TaxID=2321394 RepID=A0ABM6Z528_9ACTO|nr:MULTISPECIES: large conductance mechanosensitive channel protein MscL [Actinomyces]AYD90448.1 large conductance mechanosensitive channel protein MscL [Actinomyces lilanjuaniae]RJF40404.1 large conductance mechanosensitive channel protein MscL [Actinomyces sp. 2119]